MLVQNQDLKSLLESTVGKDNVADDFIGIPTIHLDTYADVTSNRAGMRKQKFVVRPESVEQVCEVVKIAGKNRVPVIPLGGATTFFVSGGPVPVAEESIVVDLRSMTRILELNEKDRTVTVEAGVTVQDLKVFLERRKLYFPHHPESYNSATVIGAICINGISPFSTKYGRPAEQVVRMKVVLSDGEVCTVGNKTSFDNAFMVTKLFSGVNGALGIVVEATVKVYPIPKTRMKKLYGFVNASYACTAVTKINDAGLSPEVVMIPSKERIYNEALLPILSSIDVSEILESRESFVLVAYSGSEEVVKFSIEQTDKIMTASGGVEIEPRVAESYWSNLTELGAVLSPQMARVYEGHKYNSSRGGIPLASLPEFVEEEKKIIPEGGRLIDDGVTAYVFLPQLDADPICGILIDDTQESSVSEFNEWLREVSILNKKLGGTLAAVGGLSRMFHHLNDIEMGDSKKIMIAIKKALDPYDIMNPGKLV